MSLKKFFNNLRAAELDLAWCHWNRLGAAGAGRVNTCSTDPEALILLTSVAGRHDLRLTEVMGEWLDAYGSLVSVERLKGLTKVLQEEKGVTAETFDILRECLSIHDAKRWRSVTDLMGGVRSRASRAVGKGLARKKLDAHDGIIKRNRQLFLRLMFGVGSRADIIYYAGVVLNQEKNPFKLDITAPHMSRMLHYNNSSIFRTLGDLEQAGVLTADPKAVGRKNKVYIPNLSMKEAGQLFGAAAAVDKRFIDWLAVAKLCLGIESLEDRLDGVTDESIVKSRLNDFAKLSSSLAAEACVDLKDTLAEGHYRALIRVGIGELQGSILANVSGVVEFVTQ